MSPLNDHTNDDLRDLADSRDVAVPGGKSANKDTIIEALVAAGVEDDALDAPASDDADASGDDDADAAGDGDGPDPVPVTIVDQDDDEDDIEDEDVEAALDEADENDGVLEPDATYGAHMDDVPAVGPEEAKRVGDNGGAIPVRVETDDTGAIRTWWCAQCGRSHTVEFDVCEACNTPAIGIKQQEAEVVIHDDGLDDDD